MPSPMLIPLPRKYPWSKKKIQYCSLNSFLSKFLTPMAVLVAQSRGPKPKFFNWYITWAPTSMYNQIFKDVGYMIKISKFWIFGARGLKTGGPKPKFFNCYVTWDPTSMYNRILKDLAYIIKILKFWPFGAWGLKTGAPNQNFSTAM